MDIKEEGSFIIFENVDFKELDLFRDLPYKLWFLKGFMDDGLFQVTFNAQTLDIKKDDVKENEFKDDNDLEVHFTLYFLKDVI